MGNTLHTPPRSRHIRLTHTAPDIVSVDGFVAGNQYTLSYTLLEGRDTVADLLALTQQHANPDGSGIVGVRRPPTPTTPAPPVLAPTTVLADGDHLTIVLAHEGA